MATIDKVRVIVVGDSGVGKTSLVHLIANNEPIKSPSWTVGCSVEVKLHEYKEGTPVQKTYFIELWDVGGSSQHRNARSVFYNPTHGTFINLLLRKALNGVNSVRIGGVVPALAYADDVVGESEEQLRRMIVNEIGKGIILTHDLSNKKSQENLQKWLSEILNREEKPPPMSSPGKYVSVSFEDYDQENFVGSAQIPILVIGTKLDLAEDKFKNYQQISDTIAQQCGAEELVLDCRQNRYLAAGSTNAVKLSRFFDKVIERKYYNRDASPFGDRRKYPSNYLGNNYNNMKYYHKD